VPAPRGSDGGVSITWLGHATVLIDLDGTRVLTDPVLRDRIGPLVRIAETVRGIDVGTLDGVLLSHLHADHTDLPTLRGTLRGVPVIAPYPARTWLEKRGVRDVHELRRGEELSVNTVRVAAVDAAHDARRSPLLGPAADPLGYVVRGSKSVYFAGDTDLFDAMSELRGTIDVALLPVAGWGPRLPPGHLNPESAAAALTLIEPAVAIPIHWGTLARGFPARRPADPGRPAADFAEHARRAAPAVEVRIIAPGTITRIG
jgi:L-ascorbate metabolism protein UlaG (beta-lactamase superfamily)